MGTDKNVAKYAGPYMQSILPGIAVFGLLDIDRQFMACYEVNYIAFQCQIFSPFIHLVICYAIVISLDFGVVGSGFSMFLTSLIIYIV